LCAVQALLSRKALSANQGLYHREKRHVDLQSGYTPGLAPAISPLSRCGVCHNTYIPTTVAVGR
jgi:hypothetical protein